MKKFFNLVNFEMNRFSNFLLPTLLVTIILQLFVTFRMIYTYNGQVERFIATQPSGAETILQTIGGFSMKTVTDSGIYALSIVFIILIFMFYSFFTWYRDWLGKNTFAYRLLMLPINRLQLFVAKAVVFLIGGLFAFVVQFGLFYVQGLIAQQMIANELFIKLSVHDVKPIYDYFLFILFPTSGIEFLKVYSFAFAALISLFTGIIIERCFGLKGLIFGVIYFVGYFVIYLVLSNVYYLNVVPFVLRPSQIYLGLIFYQFFSIALGTLISNFLLKNKIKI